MSEELDRLESVLRQYPSVLIALSGGVDSSVVAAAAHRVLGDHAIAVTLRGPSLPNRDRAAAHAVADKIGIRHYEETVDQLQSPQYASNPTDRCYFCRNIEGGALRELATQWGASAVLDGVHLDDRQNERPGIRAMNEWGLKHPLLEAKLGKTEVRALALELDLPNHDTPSNSCLASRVRHGDQIRRETLGQIDLAEEYLLGLGFERVRVRVSGGVAEVQVEAAHVDRLREPAVWTKVTASLISLGFRTVTMDPAGFRGTPARAL